MAKTMITVPARIMSDEGCAVYHRYASAAVGLICVQRKYSVIHNSKVSCGIWGNIPIIAKNNIIMNAEKRAHMSNLILVFSDTIFLATSS